MSITKLSSKTQAWLDGYKAGKQDRSINWCSRYAWFIEQAPGYTQDYSIGYRDGWHGRF